MGMKAFAYIAALAAATLAASGCAGSHNASAPSAQTGGQAKATQPSGRIHFSVVGAAPSGAWIAYIPTSDSSGPAPPPRISLTSDARLPYHATRSIDPAKTAYFLNASTRRKGHITCTVRIGRVSDTSQGTGTDAAVSPCVAALRWRARLGRWVNGRPGSSRFTSK